MLVDVSQASGRLVSGSEASHWVAQLDGRQLQAGQQSI